MPLVDWARNQIVEAALVSTPPPTHLFWIDTDIVVPADVVSTLLSYDEDIVGGVYCRRTEPYDPMVFNLDPFQILNDFDKSKYQQVDGMGMGCMLVRLSVYQRMAEHFGDHAWHKATWPEQGEDVWFFKRIKEMGLKAYVDPTIRCQHLTLSYATYQDIQ